MIKTATGAQRYNNRMNKIFETYRKQEEAKDKAFQELLKLVSPDGMINFVTEKLAKLKTTQASMEMVEDDYHTISSPNLIEQ